MMSIKLSRLPWLMSCIRTTLTIAFTLSTIASAVKIVIIAWVVYMLFFNGMLDLLPPIVCENPDDTSLCNLMVWIVHDYNRVAIALYVFFYLKG